MNNHITQMLHGDKRSESEHDEIIYQTSFDLVELHNVYNDKESVIPFDFKMTDRIFDAAIELLENTGIFCTDTNRVIRVSKEEIKRNLDNAQPSFTIGQNSETNTAYFRNVLDTRIPLIMGGPTAVPVSEDQFVPIHRSYTKIKSIACISPATLHENVFEKNNPLKMLEGHKAVNFVNEACRLEGRLGMSCVSPPFIEDPLTSISIANPKIMGPGDLQEFYPLPDLKADLSQISRVVHYKTIGVPYLVTNIMIMGGMTSSTPEQFAIQMVAESIKNKLLYSAPMGFITPSTLQTAASRSLETMWAIFSASMAISRNARFLHGIVIQNSSGPCTESMMYETAVQTIGSTICGTDSLAGPIPNRGSSLNHAGGLDALFMIKTAELATALNLDDANYLCMELYNMYADQKPEIGKKFDECYNITNIEASQEYYETYDTSLNTIYDILGAKISE
jgi:methylamine--corrinoid protein Co-methyltransferase